MKRPFYFLIILLLSVGHYATGQNNLSHDSRSDQKYVVMEELTGTWCQWCPGGTYTGRDLTQQYDNIIFIAIHCNDDMEDTEYYQASGLSAAPSADINRVYQDVYIGEWESKALSEMSVTPPAYIDVTTSYNSTTRELTATISADFIQNLSGDYRLGGAVIEDAVTGPSPGYDQSNSYSGGGNGPMGGFENLPNPVPASMIAYDHVARGLLGGYTGDAGSLPSAISSGETHSYTYTYTLPDDYNPDYVRIVGWLVNQSNSRILNAGKSLYLNGMDNGKPHFIPEPQDVAYVGTQYNYQIYCADPEEDNLTLSVVNIPSWLTLQQTTQNSVHTAGSLSGTPTSQGTFDVTIAVSDGNSTTEKSWQIVVEGAQSGQWEIVGNPGFSNFSPSGQVLSLGPDDTPYVAYDSYSDPIQVKKYDGSGWVMVGSSPGTADRDFDMAVDNDNNPWVVYDDANSNGKIYVKKYNGSSWETIGGGPVSLGTCGSSCIEFDEDGTPYIAFYEQNQNYAGYVYKFTGSAWEAVGGGPISSDVALWFKLDFDSQGNPNVLWAKAPSNYVFYSRVSAFDGSTWNVLGGGDIASDITYYSHDMVIDQNDDVYVSIVESVGVNLNVYKFTGSGWQNISEGEGLLGEYQSITVNSEGDILLGFQNMNMSSQTSVMQYSDNNWSFVGSPTISGVAERHSIDMGSDDTPYITYVDIDNNEKTTCQRYVSIPTPVIHLSASEIEFDTTLIGNISEETIIISNNGNAVLDITSISSTNYVFSTDITSLTIQPNESETLTVFFEPELEQDYEGLIQLYCNDPASSNIDISVSGYGIMTTGIERDNSIELNIYPNPFIEGFTVTGFKSIQKAEIIDLFGKSIDITYSVANNNIVSVNIPAGIYTLRIESGGIIYTNRLIKR